MRIPPSRAVPVVKLLTAICAVGPLWALGSDVLAQGGQPLGRSTVTGDVRLVDDGDPVPSVEVWAVDDATGLVVSRTLTDAVGRFVLRPPPGRLVIAARRDGFLESRFGSLHHSLPGVPLIVEPHETQQIRLVLHRAPLVAGVVRDDAGRPIENATVAIARATNPGAGGGDVVARLRTDPSGSYRSDGLLPGHYVLAAMAASPLPPGDPAARYRSPAGQFHGGSDTDAQTALIALAEDEQRTGVDFVLPRRELSMFAGAVVPPESVVLRDEVIVVVTGTDGSPPTVDTPQVAPDGRFALLLHPGRYRVEVRAVGRPKDHSPEEEGRVYFATGLVDVDHTPAIFREFRVAQGIRVSGAVRAATGPIGDVRVRFGPIGPRRATMRPVEVATSEDGRFGAGGLAPGRYRVELSDPDGTWELEAVRFGGRLQQGPLVEVGASAEGDELELTAAPRTAAVSGRLVGATAPHLSFVVALVRQGTALVTADPVLARPDSRGGYQFTRQRPGTYMLFLLENPDPSELANASYLDRLRASGSAIAVTLQAGVLTRMDVRVVR